MRIYFLLLTSLKLFLTLVKKFFHYFILIFYDDLEFKAMSLPRTTIGILTALYVANWIFAHFYGIDYSMESFPMVYATAWGAYSVKAWKNREHSGYQNEEQTGGGINNETIESSDEP